MSSIKQRIKHFIFSIVATIGALLIVNFLCSLLAQDKYVKLDLVDSSNFFNSYGYFPPNQQKRMIFPGITWAYKLTINSLGLRTTGNGVDFKELQNYKNRILCVGDSMTFGLYVDDEQTYPYLLQDIINKNNKDAIVLNAGVGSTGIRDHLDYIKKRGLQLNPAVIIVNFFGNDITDKPRELSYYEERKQSPPKSLEQLFKATSIPRAIWTVYVHLKYKRWVSKEEDARVRDILTHSYQDIESSLYASKERHTWDSILDPYKEELRESWNTYFAYLKQLSDLCKSKDIKLIFLIQPEILSVFEQTNGSHEELLKRFLVKHDIDCVDIVPILKKDKENILSYYVNPPRDFHLSKKGYSVVAEEIYDLISRDL